MKTTVDGKGVRIDFLSWDTEGSSQTRLNLLREGAVSAFQVKTGGKWRDGGPFVADGSTADGVVSLRAAGKTELLWTSRTNGAGMTWTLKNVGKGGVIEAVRVTLPFNPCMAATTILPARWTPPDGFALPAVLSAADFGQLLVRQSGGSAATGRFTGSRPKRLIDVSFEIPTPAVGETVSLDFSPWHLPAPRGIDDATWQIARRGWWNLYEPCVFGEGLACFPTAEKAPAGILSNNPISDPVSCLYAFIADHALLAPELAPGISAETTLRHSVEWWLDRRTDPSGAVVGYAEIKDMLDAPCSIIVAAWACVEISGNLDWAGSRVPLLEKIADYLAARDVDGDGIVESPKSGNANALRNPLRGATAWDTVNSGHKELYINALCYRAFCCLADLEKRLDRKEKAKRYGDLADRLRKAFFLTFHSPATGLLSWWISADGQRHDYWAPGILGLPVAYGLVPRKEAEKLLTLVHDKVKATGFVRLELGLPCVLEPIRRADYLIGLGPEFGCPKRDDGSDAFRHYLNGGCLVSDQIHWLNAHYRLERTEEVAPQLAAMLRRQAKPVFPNGGSFQNGIVNQQPKGAEFFDWDGNTCGYEGHLVYSFFFLQAVLTQRPEYLRRILHPLPDAPSQD
ncbi:MAG: hypothetical protein JW951_09580 [Lentisphaerae bacterium]|nr:hypothetical protein [Lentisphaerota bacterium]